MTASVDNSQHGMATLLFCAMLLGAATTLVFTLARTGISEQHIIASIHQHERLRQAGTAGLTYAIAWLRGNTPAWQQATAGWETTIIPLPGDNLGQDQQLTIRIDARRQQSAPAYILLSVQTWYADNDPQFRNSRYRLRQYVHVAVITAQTYRAQVLPLPGTWHDFGDV